MSAALRKPLRHKMALQSAGLVSNVFGRSGLVSCSSSMNGVTSQVKFGPNGAHTRIEYKGKVYEFNRVAQIQHRGNKVFVDGVEIGPGPTDKPIAMHIHVTGNVEGGITAESVEVKGDVSGSIRSESADVHVGGNVNGNVSTMSGDVHVKGGVSGDVSTMSGDVSAGSVSGGASSMYGSVHKK